MKKKYEMRTKTKTRSKSEQEGIERFIADFERRIEKDYQQLLSKGKTEDEAKSIIQKYYALENLKVTSNKPIPVL